jgi:tetratricopeptide (TPR) repeat protein
MAAKEYEQAAKAYRDAAAYIQTQEALAGIKTAEAELNRAKVAADLAEQKKKADEKRLGTAAEKLAEGRSAIAAGDIPKALAALRSAKALKPGDLEIEKSLAEAEALQDKAQTAARQQKELQNQTSSLQRQIDLGQQSLKARQYDAAISAFSEALRIDPKNPQANAGLQSAQAAQKESVKGATTGVPKTDPVTPTGGKADALVAKARAAIKAKDMETAYQAIVEASKLDPRDPDVQKVRSEYEAARKELTTSASDADAKKKQAQYEAAMSAAQMAMTAKKYEDAVAKATEALRVKPGDAAANSLLNQAKRAESAAETAATEAKKKDEAYRQNIQDATAALSARKFDVAIREAKEALAIKPGDPAATRLLTDAQKGEAATTAAAETDKQQEAYNKAMQAGRTAYGARKFEDALAQFEAALKAKPGDSVATQSIAVVKKAIANTTVAAEPKKENPATGAAPAVDPKRKELYDAWLAHADKLMAAKSYKEAVEAYGNALKALPNDPTALKGQAAAKAAMSTSEPVTPKKDPVIPKADPVAPKRDPVVPKTDPTATRVAALLKEAADDEHAGRYGEAHTGYQEVLKLAPTNAEAKKRSTFCQWMDQGKSHLAAGKAADAVASFQQALKIDPNDANARQLLQQAQQSQPKPKKK